MLAFCFDLNAFFDCMALYHERFCALAFKVSVSHFLSKNEIYHQNFRNITWNVTSPIMVVSNLMLALTIVRSDEWWILTRGTWLPALIQKIIALYRAVLVPLNTSAIQGNELNASSCNE